MSSIKVRFVLNRGRTGAPLAKLGKVSEQAEKFLRSLAADMGIETKPSEWLALNFENGSIEYDAQFQGDVGPGEAQNFVRSLEYLSDFDPTSEGLNGAVSDATALEYAKMGALIDPDEVIGLGIYPARGGAIRWRQITYQKTSQIRRQLETPLPAYGALQGIVHAWFKEARDPNFQLREHASDNLVRVYYPPQMYSRVAQAVQERTTMLIVSGDCLYDRSSRQAAEMRCDRIEAVGMLSSGEFERFFGSAPQFEGDVENDGDELHG